ncbi:hypothetical protein [Halobacteriovorax sp. JY17]|uniref:hypothetical protein n=1 Tax=Halobacteriovorax sp. JY17 TaxID=2014617 RepID=UPI000C62D6EA|nr:hypothetical protein [Halobacteriovorax sp. JY17]PIK16134.1 MAG: hypothetical protein CES88_05215 [Halobacteriovorax sp. JY17]
MAKIISILSLFILISCSKEERYSASQMWKMAQTKDPNIELVIITDPAKRILCENYHVKGCIRGSGKRIKLRLVDLIAIEFDTEENARAAALTYNQYYARNWFFDDVKGEPVLENFVKEVFDAKNPKSSK